MIIYKLIIKSAEMCGIIYLYKYKLTCQVQFKAIAVR